MSENKLSEMQHLLACLTEECGEVSQVVGKCLRFGVNDRHPKRADIPNRDLLFQELNDLFAVAELLGFRIDRLAVEEKQGKVEKYMKYSAKVNLMEPTNGR